MRKVLLATTALVGVALAGAAHAAASSPISLNVGGYTDFVAGVYNESDGVPTPATTKGPRTSRDFETEFKLNFDAIGKGSNGIEYGANISLWNGPEATNAAGPWAGGAATVNLNSAYVWLSGSFGKVLFGDEHGASDLIVYAPTIGEGQVDGRYMDFVDPVTLSRVYASGLDNTEHSTKITYYTPKVGNESNKVQLGLSYAPNLYDYGSNVLKYNAAAAANATSTSGYQDVIEAGIEFWGNWRPVNVAASFNLNSGSGGANGLAAPVIFPTAPIVLSQFRDYLAWGAGLQVGTSWVSGLTIGGSYQDLGHYGTTNGQNKTQNVWSLGAKYEFDKVALAANWIQAQKYDNLLAGAIGATTPVSNHNYVSNFDAFGAGASYTWFPGLTSNVDGVLFFQNVSDKAETNDGFVVLVSQKLTF